MAISITNLYPAKNATDININSDISITLESDDADLDISSIELLINNISVKSSAYYGATKKEIKVGFFAKHKIKYNTRRYHANGTPGPRYGQRDIYPSIFEYGYKYVCTIKAKDIDGLEFFENFSFTIEEGIFFSDKIKTLYYYPQTQAVANYTPEWAKARYDKYSNFQQFINPSMKYMEKIDFQLSVQKQSYFVQTAPLNELSNLYKIELGDDYSFSSTVLDDGTSLQIPPDIVAIKGVTKFYPTAEFNNDISTFFYNKIPDRMDEEKIKIESLEILPLQDIRKDLIILNKKLERNGTIIIKISEARNLIKVYNKDIIHTTCRIKGFSRENKRQTEDIAILGNENYITRKLWKRIESIQFIDLQKNTFFKFSVDHTLDKNDFIEDIYSYISFNDFKKSIYWKKEDTIFGSILQKWVVLGDDMDAIISSKNELDIISEMELMDINGSTNLFLDAIATDKYTEYIYGIDSNYIYIFNKNEEYPSIIKELESAPISGMVIDLDSKELGRGDSVKKITLKCIQRDISKEIAYYRLSVKKPDGVVEYIKEDNSITLQPNDAEVVVNIKELQYSSSVLFYDLDIPGDYLIKLETVYRNGAVDVDTKIARINTKTALAKYKTEKLLGEASIKRFFVDFDQQLKILDSNNELHTIRWARDNMLVDYNNAIVYFSEDYVETEVL